MSQCKACSRKKKKGKERTRGIILEHSQISLAIAHDEADFALCNQEVDAADVLRAMVLAEEDELERVLLTRSTATSVLVPVRATARVLTWNAMSSVLRTTSPSRRRFLNTEMVVVQMPTSLKATLMRRSS